MNCSFTKTSAASRKSTARQSNAARKKRRQKLAAAAETALRNEEEPSNAPVVQATDKEHRLDSEHGLNLDNVNHKQDVSNNDTVRPSDMHCLENQQSEQQSAAPEAELEEKPQTFEKPYDDQYCISASDCKLLQAALNALPQRRDHMDALVLSFFQNVNPHYGLIHQTEFAAEYSAWWEKRAKNEPLPIPWTCLLLMLCACACQHLPVDIQEKLEEMFHASCQNLTESYHYCARNLYGVIPEGQYHRHNVMWLLHSTYWYKAEAMFVECCHVFNTAVREAQELGFNREELSEHLPSFEREMRRRAWCIIDSWDWQISSGLCRDTLIDHSTCNVQRPSLTLELDGQFSPLMHMNMQSDLVHKLAERFQSPAKITTPSEVMEYKEMIADWMRNFPAIFALENPDTSHDEEQTWIEYHRHYNYTMGYMLLLNPFRPHMKLLFEQDAPEDRLELRDIAIDMSIRLVKVLDDWINYLTFRDGRFHFIIFSLVDAATMLANVIFNDKAGSVTRRNEIYQTLETSRLLQGKLYCLSRSAKLGFRIISKTFKKVMNTAPAEDYALLPDGKDDTEQTVLAAAMESISLCVENRIDPGKQKQKAAGALTEVYTAETGLQPSPFSHTDDSSVSMINDCHGGHGHHGHTRNDAHTSSHYAVAATAQPDYDGQKIPGPYAAASEEHGLPMSSTYDPAAPSSYTATAPAIDFVATSSYAGPPQVPNYNEPTPLEYATSTAPGYTTSASLAGPAIASAYIEPTVLDHIYSAPLGDVGVTFPNNTSIPPFVYDNTLSLDIGTIPSSYYDATLSSDYSTTGPPYAEATLPMYNAFAYLENTGVMSVDNLTANPPLFSAPTAYDTLTSHQIQLYPGYDATGLDTTCGTYNNPAGPQDFVSDTVPMTYSTSATSASYSSPETHPHSETYSAPVLYNTEPPYSDPTTCIDSATSFTSPESNSSSANFDAAETHLATAATAAYGPYAHAEYCEDTAQQYHHF
ncbi:hypothetical protein GGI43DRAFT_381659 [Trichoderma evansii]